MDSWWLGLIAILVVGVGVIAYGAASDRRRNRREATRMLAPPDRAIPGYQDSAAPHYLSELQARRPPSEPPTTALSGSEREAIRSGLAEASTVKVAAHRLSEDFVTDPVTGWATVATPQVLVCAEPVSTVRELLVALPGAGRPGSALVVVAPAYAADVRATLEVNVIQRRLALIAVVADAAATEQITATTGARAVPRSDLQAGYLPAGTLGHCARWVATRDASFIVSVEAQ